MRRAVSLRASDRLGPKPRYQLLSLDVFDTCLIRDFIWQESLWQALGQRLAGVLPNVSSSAEFATMRGIAEEQARAACEGEDTPLADVYRRLREMYSWTLSDQRMALDLEEELEASGVRANPAVLPLFERAHGAALCYLTDTPHRGAFIRRCLDEQGIPPGPVLSSGDLGARKGTGSLFREAMSRFNVGRRELLHIGNDYRVDGTGSAIAGAAFSPLVLANPNRYERTLDTSATRSAGMLGPCMAGAGRVFRLEEADHVPAGLLSVVAGVAGPIILAAAAWCLLSAEADDIDTLYFVARDGEILLSVAQLLRRELGIASGVECRYLHGSRRAWHLPALSLEEGPSFASALRTLLDRSRKTTLVELFALLDLTDDEQEAIRSEVVPEIPRDSQLGDDRSRVIDALVDSALCQTLASSHARAAYERTASYLRQEAMFESSRVGLVDIGWLGHAAASLVAMADAHGTAVRSYFVGGLLGRGSERAPKDYGAFLVDARGQEPAISPALVHLMESFCSGTESSTTGYEEVNGRYLPHFDSDGGGIALKWGLAEYQALVGQYVQAMTKIIAKVPWTITLPELDALRPALLRNLETLWSYPTYAEAVHWGDFPWEVMSGPPVKLGRALTRDEIVGRLLHLGTSASRPRTELPWRRATLVRSFGGARIGNPLRLLELLPHDQRRAQIARVRRRIRGGREVSLADVGVRHRIRATGVR